MGVWIYLQVSRFLIWSHEDGCLWRFDEAFGLLVLSAKFCGEEVRSGISSSKYVSSEASYISYVIPREKRECLFNGREG